MKTWVDTENPLLPKDGYLQFEFKKQGITQVPTNIVLADGSKATAKQITLPDGSTAYLVRSKKESIVAVPMGPGSGGGFYFFRPTSQQGSPRDIYTQNQQWTPTESKLGRLFQLASNIANRGDAPVTSPADLATAKKARDVAASASVAKSVDQLTQAAASTRTKLAEASASMAGALKDLAPALQQGVVVNRRNAQGEITFEVAEDPNMKPSEHRKLEEKFGDRLRNLSMSARVVERELKRASAMREGTAAELMQQVNSGPFLASLEKLSPAERMAKVNQIAAQVAGTKAGSQLARDLFAFDRSRLDPSMGQLTPSSELGKLLFKDVYKDPAAVVQLKGLATNLAGQLPGGHYDAMERMFEIGLGRQLTTAESHASFELANAKPEQLDSGKGFDKFGDVTDLLSAFGEGADKAAMHGTKAAFNAGAAIVGTYQLIRGVAEFAKDPSAEGVVNVTEDATRSAGAWAGWLTKEGTTLSKVGKSLGIASDVIGLVKDMKAMHDAQSPDKKYDGFVNSYASALIIAGTLAADATPWGIAAQVVGLGIKLLREETSDSYDNAYGTLKKATKTQAEKDAEAAARKADYDRRSTREVGNRI